MAFAFNIGGPTAMQSMNCPDCGQFPMPDPDQLEQQFANEIDTHLRPETQHLKPTLLQMKLKKLWNNILNDKTNVLTAEMVQLKVPSSPIFEIEGPYNKSFQIPVHYCKTCKCRYIIYDVITQGSKHTDCGCGSFPKHALEMVVPCFQSLYDQYPYKSAKAYCFKEYAVLVNVPKKRDGKVS